MKKLKFIPLVMFSVMLLASCQSKESKIEKLVTSHLEQSLENPQNLKVLEIAQPDSAFGLNYFTKQEQAYMMNTITDVTKVLMERTDYMTNPNLDDAYTMTLADLEMRMSSGLFSGMLACIRHSVGIFSIRNARLLSVISTCPLSTQVRQKRQPIRNRKARRKDRVESVESFCQKSSKHLIKTRRNEKHD